MSTTMNHHENNTVSFEVPEKTVKIGDEEVTELEFKKRRQAGKIVFRPQKGADGNIQTSDGSLYQDDNGTLRRVDRLNGTPKRMSKKQRRKYRRAMEGV